MRLSQPEQMAQGLRATFATLAAFGEVVLHELLEPSRALLATHHRVSGRQMGDLRIELGRARMVGPQHPQLTANYANRCTDGESAKSTGTGMKHSGDAMNKSLDPAGAGAWRDRIVQLAARLARAPRALTTHEQGTLLRELKLWLEGYTLSDGNRSMVCRGVSDGRAPLFK